MSSVNRINVQSAKTESKADLVSMEASGGKHLVQNFSNLQYNLSIPFIFLKFLLETGISPTQIIVRDRIK